MPSSSDAIAVAHLTSPRVSAYPWTAGAFGTKVANPGTLPTGQGYSVAFTNSNDTIAVAHYTTPFVSAYPWTGAFGTKIANPGTSAGGTASKGVAFSAANDAIALAQL